MGFLLLKSNPGCDPKTYGIFEGCSVALLLQASSGLELLQYEVEVAAEIVERDLDGLSPWIVQLDL